AATGLPGEKIRVVTELVGGSFGIRSYSYAEHVAVMLAAQTLGRPVKWVATRSEIFLSDNQGRGLTLAGELALARDGGFLALRFEDGADLGAFSTPFGPQIGSRNITITMGGVYRIAAMHAHTRCASSNAVPARREREKREGKLRGSGIATFLEASAAGVAPKDQAYARFDASGILHVSCVSQSTGQGHETAFVRILCEGLGVTGERIRIHEG